MALPVVAIVGRPNVGKSSLLNCLIRRRVSIVEPTAGVTRDRVSAICDVGERYFELVDTGGFGVVDADDLKGHIERQIRYAIDAAALILFVVDARDGILPLDRRVADLLRRHNKPVGLVANKIDEPHHEPLAAEFAGLGFGDARPVSALNGFGRSELAEWIAQALDRNAATAVGDPVMKLAIVGKRNTGKSTFVNALAGEERVIVSEIPGTTRDAVDVRFEKDGRTFLAIDTAGVRKQRKFADAIEFYGYTRALSSIRRSDVSLLFIDSTASVSRVDKKLALAVASEHKPCVLVINKWDLAKGKAGTQDYADYLDKTLPELSYAPVAFVSARENHNVDAAIDIAWVVFKQAQLRVGTGKLNQVLAEALALRGPSPKRGARPPKIYYATQVATGPPTIVLFANAPKLIKPDYQRFLINRFREQLPFAEVPIRLIFRASRGRVPPR